MDEEAWRQGVIKNFLKEVLEPLLAEKLEPQKGELRQKSLAAFTEAVSAIVTEAGYEYCARLEVAGLDETTAYFRGNFAVCIIITVNRFLGENFPYCAAFGFVRSEEVYPLLTIERSTIMNRLGSFSVQSLPVVHFENQEDIDTDKFVAVEMRPVPSYLTKMQDE